MVMLDRLSAAPEAAASEARAIAEKILKMLNKPYRLERYKQYSTPSIGIALFSDAQKLSAGELLKRADLAMYGAKSAGRNTFRFFDAQTQAAATSRARLEADLRHALHRKAFTLHYQPQVSADGKITGVEALLRWNHPQGKAIPPSTFIPVAEDSGLIIPLGQWVMEQACFQLARWTAHPAASRLTMSVNVSVQQFRYPGFVAHVLSVLDRSGADPYRLKLEITESLLDENVEETIEEMNALKEKGVSFSLDDFGTGYSSLSYLKRLPLDSLKIDQSFIRDILVDPNDAAIARTIIALGQSMGLHVIAEGVETAAQHAFLAVHGCHAYQGYLFSRPLPAGEMEKFMDSYSHDARDTTAGGSSGAT